MTEILPPTSHLPPIKQISSKGFTTINASISYLRSIYNPEVRGSRRQKGHQNHDPTGNTLNVQAVTPRRADALHHLRTDSFERAYAIQWLTALIALLNGDSLVAVSTQEQEQIVHDAASLLALCSGSSAAGTTVRNFTFDYHPPARGDQFKPPIPITITLTDNSLDNSDFRSVGAQTWGGACVLSEMIVEDPARFGLSIDQLKARKRFGVFRILELGAGTGLVSLTVRKLLDEIGLGESHRIEIIATDYYPSVLANLRANIDRNVHEKPDSPVTILTERLDWSSFGLDEASEGPLHGPFDLIFGADVVYEREHAKWIHSCLTHLLRKPPSSESSDTDVVDSAFHLVVPLRSTYSSESASVEKVFTAEPSSSFPSVQIMAKDTLICDTETGEEVEYAYYKIGWLGDKIEFIETGAGEKAS